MQRSSTMFTMKKIFSSNFSLILFVLVFGITSFSAQAEDFALPKHYPTIVGQWHRVTVGKGDSIGKISMRYGVSMHNIRMHNPRLTKVKYIHPGESMIVPACYWVPEEVAPGEIVVNIATHTLFFRPTEGAKLMVFPVTVGTPENPTPPGEFYIKKKKLNPIWYPPQSIRASYAKKGKSLPFAVEGGRGNPLGKYAMYLNKPTYLIHTASGIKALGGMQSFGCVRMYENDIKKLYPIVPVKTKVRIIDVPNTHEDLMYNHCAKALNVS